MQAIDDGSSLHGVLLSTRPLVQMYTNNTCNPDWHGDDNPNQPTIYLSLKSGGVEVAGNTTDIQWTYNGITIQFNETTGKSVNVKPGCFMKITYSGAPALKIVDNLAQSDIVDQDVIGINGNYATNGAEIPFTLYATIKLASVAPGEYRGIIFPATYSSAGNTYSEGGPTIFKDDQKDVYLFVRLYSHEGEVTDTRAYSTKWYIGTEEVPAETNPFPTARLTPITIGGVEYQGLHLTDQDVEDYSIIEVEFYTNNQKVNSAYIEVDDQIDDLMMYISTIIRRNGSQLSPEVSESGEGSTVYLRSTDDVNASVRMGKASNPSETDERYKWFYVKFVSNVNDMDNNTDTESYAGISDVVTDDSDDPAYGWRPMSGLGVQTHGEFTVSYPNLVSMGRKITGFLLARTSALVVQNQQP